MARDFDAVVIGSGLGGLTAGALYARVGHRVLLLERNDNFGGAATVYRHGALSIEASLHETTDPHDVHDPSHQIFQALGILDDIEFVPVGDLYEVRCRLLKEPFVLSHGIEAARAALQSRFPAHEKALVELFQRLNAVNKAVGLFSEQHGGLWWFLHAPAVPLTLWPVLRDMKKSLADVFSQLFGNDEAIKIALAANLPYYADDPEQMWWLFYAVAQGGFLSGGGHYIRGGSQALSNRLVKVIEEEGGSAEAGRTVTRILLDEQGRAMGVEHESRQGGDPRTDLAPVLFGNAAPNVLAEALPAEARDAFMQPYMDKPLSLSLFSISLGLARRPAEFGVSNYSTVLVPDWITALADYRHNAALLSELPGEQMPLMSVVDYSRVDSGLNAQPPFLLSVVGLDRLSNWQRLSREAYHHKRDRWLAAIIQRLEKEYPGLAGAITQSEMATALTMHQYLNSPEGALYGFAPRPPEHFPLKGPPRTPRTSIAGLWLASAYASSGGFTGAMMGGASAAQMAMKSRES
ncbi:MAG TPA: NAD(P)/FAD-dependent oxidoreductase [Gammaproteobacteria bacterium]|nr:NAD(P)/FAD-dependent oxidoreductase [Gammaproteobacteria bacterium]